MGTKYWIGVVGAKHAVTGRSRGICAFSHGKEQAISKLTPGDRFAYYAPRDGNPIWVRSATYDLEARTPVRPLLERLAFVTNPKNWGMAFRRSLFEISAEDFALIETAMRESE